MAVERFATRATSLADTAKMFSENGVDIADCYEGEIGPVHMIRFHGDESAGFKAVEIARDIGLVPSQLYRVWPVQFYDDQSHWELTFFYPDLDDGSGPEEESPILYADAIHTRNSPSPSTIYANSL